jgi:hypothetical protein
VKISFALTSPDPLITAPARTPMVTTDSPTYPCLPTAVEYMSLHGDRSYIGT